MFVALMVVGLGGLFFMAMPAFSRHGHVHLHGRAHAGHLGGARGGGAARVLTRGGDAGAAASAANVPADTRLARALRWIPSPRAVCSVLALYGAFGNALVRAGHLRFATAALVAALPALLVERLVVRPVWNLLFRFQGEPSTPLDALLFSEAQAVVPFRNGRGLVSVVRDGRVIQLSATLRGDQGSLPVRVGERLRIEEVDARRERVTVTVLALKE